MSSVPIVAQLRTSELIGRGLQRIRDAIIDYIQHSYYVEFGEDWENCIEASAGIGISSINQSTTRSILHLILDTPVWDVLRHNSSGALTHTLIREVQEVQSLWYEERFEREDEMARHAIFVIIVILHRLEAEKAVTDTIKENEHFLFGFQFSELALNELYTLEKEISKEIEESNEYEESKFDDVENSFNCNEETDEDNISNSSEKDEKCQDIPETQIYPNNFDTNVNNEVVNDEIQKLFDQEFSEECKSVESEENDSLYEQNDLKSEGLVFANESNTSNDIHDICKYVELTTNELEPSNYNVYRFIVSSESQVNCELNNEDEDEDGNDKDDEDEDNENVNNKTSVEEDQYDVHLEVNQDEILVKAKSYDVSVLQQAVKLVLEHIQNNQVNNAMFAPPQDDEVIITEIAMEQTREWIEVQKHREHLNKIFFYVPESEKDKYLGMLNKHFPLVIERDLARRTSQLVSKVSRYSSLQIPSPDMSSAPISPNSTDEDTSNTQNFGENEIQDDSNDLNEGNLSQEENDPQDEDKCNSQTESSEEIEQVNCNTTFIGHLRRALSNLSSSFSFKTKTRNSSRSHASENNDSSEENEPKTELYSGDLRDVTDVDLEIMREVAHIKYRLVQAKIQEIESCNNNDNSGREVHCQYDQLAKEFAAREYCNGKRKRYLDVCMEMQDEFNVDARCLRKVADMRLEDCMLLFAKIAQRIEVDRVKNIFRAHSFEFVQEHIDRTFQIFDSCLNRADSILATNDTSKNDAITLLQDLMIPEIQKYHPTINNGVKALIEVAVYRNNQSHYLNSTEHY
eukprot:gb/GECH01011795.1/.p1 GENE.gb/GECH01011795.1/~~gb/GECH01011795.1/.p1  ORF type:complete len:800 (+),score=208.37 gb/GECH01011795.1/:1-2400(+)